MESKKYTIIIVALFVIIALLLITLNPLKSMKPTDGWTLHIDAKKHIPSNDELIAHHYCKDIEGGILECQLYDSDKPNARLIGAELIIDRQTYETFSPEEKLLWHDHKEELAKVEITLPDISEKEAKDVVKRLEQTYGKVYIIWDTGKNNLPIGMPNITILE